QKWVARILQETVDSSRFLECGDNSFRNNIVYLGNNISTETNIGPNTRPETFVYSNNLWFNADNPNWSGPDIPVVETGQILNANPLFADALNDDFSIPPHSPASGAGVPLNEPKFDFLQQHFANPPSIGAIEAVPTSGAEQMERNEIQSITICPNPAAQFLWVQYELKVHGKPLVELYDMLGRRVLQLSETVQSTGLQRLSVSLPGLAEGIYFLHISTNGKTIGSKPVIINH
ncbi:MAG: T9SS type A sorting domain-containing protein, partial [Saprospiraceae bacterium]